MIVVSKNIRYMQIFAGVPWEGINCQTTVMHGLCRQFYDVLLVIYGQYVSSIATPTDPFYQSSIRDFCGRQDVVMRVRMKK